MNLMFDRPHLDARLEGFTLQVEPGTSTHYKVFTFDCSFNGLILYSNVSDIGSHVTMWTEYYVNETYGWKRYKKFAKNWQLMPGYTSKTILFPTKPSAGVRIAFEVYNNEQSDISLAFNLYQFAVLEKINPSQLEEGSNW